MGILICPYAPKLIIETCLKLDFFWLSLLNNSDQLEGDGTHTFTSDYHGGAEN